MADLTSLPPAKAWLEMSDTTGDDILLTRLITQISGNILNYLERPCITRKTYSELRSGVNNQRLVLRNWPVISIASLTINGQNIPAAATPTSAGYTLATWDGTGSGIPQEITLNGYRFGRGNNNIQIIYDAGYAFEDLTYTIPASAPYQIQLNPPGGSWAQDDGITYANGTAITPTTGAPAQGQYVVQLTSTGAANYTFSSADAGQQILISYSFNPAALEQAALELIAERYKYRGRIGQSSKSLGGNETAAYSLKGMPDYIQIALDGFKKFLPL